MSQNTIVIYVKDPKVKRWAKDQATSKNTSLSGYVSSLLEEMYQEEIEKENPLLKHFGALEGRFSKEELDEIDKAFEEARKLKNSKPDSYYENMFS